MADSEERMELICVSPEDQNDCNTKCMICHGVMENPYMALCVKKCNKSCCEVCIKKHKEHCNRCPNCNTPESLLDIHFNGSLKAKIDAQRVYCFHQPDGCEWVGERGDHQQHLNKSYDWHMIDCKFGCGHRCLGKDMEKHYAEKYRIHTHRQEVRNKRLEAELRSSAAEVQSLTAEVQSLTAEVQSLTTEVQSSAESLDFEVRSNTLLTNSLRAKVKMLQRVIHVLLIAISVLLGVVYICTPNQPTEVPIPAVKPISAAMTQAVWIRSENEWQIDIPDNSHFKRFSANITRLESKFNISFSAEPNFINDKGFKASVIVQVLDPATTHDHHVRRVDVTFTPTDNKNIFISESQALIDLNEGRNWKFYSGKLKVKIINIEFGDNQILPIEFSMCHFKHYNTNDINWTTFPFRVASYQFMIYVYANGFGSNKKKALTMKLYRMKDEIDPSSPDDFTGTDINVEVRETMYTHTKFKFTLTKSAKKRVKKGEPVEFQSNHRFKEHHVRSKHGVSITIPNDKVPRYIDQDCFIFSVSHYCSNEHCYRD